VRVLVDTHTLLWWLDGDRLLSRRARLAVGNKANTVFVSAASACAASLAGAAATSGRCCDP